MKWIRNSGAGIGRSLSLFLSLILFLSGCSQANQFPVDSASTPASTILSTPTQTPLNQPPPTLAASSTATSTATSTPVAKSPAPASPILLPTATIAPDERPFDSPLGEPLTEPLGELAGINSQIITTSVTPSVTAEISALLQMSVASSDIVTITAGVSWTLPVSYRQPISVAAQALLTTSLPAPDGVVRSVRVPVLMYHYLSDPPADANIYRLDLSVSPERFADHLERIESAGFTTISLYDLLDHLNRGTPLPPQPVIITFDDGYRDNYLNAFPLLRERGMIASFFVVTDFMDEERPEYLTWDMAREMRDAGMSIESHGRNHFSLAGRGDDFLVWQALGSLETIEYELGVRPRFVSYPAGEYDQRTIDVFASANYWAGFTTGQGATHSNDNLFEMLRVRVRSTTSADELERLLDLDW